MHSTLNLADVAFLPARNARVDKAEHDHDGSVSVTPLPRKARDALESRFRTVGRVSRGDEQWVYSAAGKLFFFNFSGLLTDAIV